MESIPSHIAYLLTRHDCVIVPGLGAFVISPSDKEKTNKWGILSPPGRFLGFDSEITHNDGLLTNTLAKTKKCSCEEANLLIEQYVSQVLNSLEEGEKVRIPWVGSLYLQEHKKLFRPERALSCNAFNYGLSGFVPVYAKDYQQQENNSPRIKNKGIARIPFNRKFIIYAGAIAAALIAVLIIPTPLNKGNFNPIDALYSGFSRFSSQNSADEKISVFEIGIETAEEDEFLPQAEMPLPESSIFTRTNIRYFYIIVSSLPDKASADRTLALFQSKGFEEAGILYSDERYRIYANRFENREEAENFLAQFQLENPTYANVWLLQKRE
jgi:hypothetical protein